MITFNEVQTWYWNTFEFGLGGLFERQSKFQTKDDCF